MPAFFFLSSIFLLLLALCRGQPTKDLIILTDMEPDDRIALAMVASRPELASRLLFVGTTLLNSKLKAALAKRQLEQTGLGHVPVYAGSGGHPSSYPNQVATASAALKFWDEEGAGILPDEKLRTFKENDATSEEGANLVEDVQQSSFGLIGPYEEIWSVLMEGIPESKAPKPADRHLEDEQTVIKLLDLINFYFPPKRVFRIPKPRGILTVGPRHLKVFFVTGHAVPFLLTEWKQKHIKIRQQTGLEDLMMYPGMNANEFSKVKEKFVDWARIIQGGSAAGGGGDIAAGRKLESDEHFFDAKEEFDEKEVEDDAEMEKEETEEAFYDTRHTFETEKAEEEHRRRSSAPVDQSSAKTDDQEQEMSLSSPDADDGSEWKVHVHKKKKNKSRKTIADDRGMLLKSTPIDQSKTDESSDTGAVLPTENDDDRELEMLRAFLLYEEEERSIIIKGLPEYHAMGPEANNKHSWLQGKIVASHQSSMSDNITSSPPPILLSQRYQWDFNAVVELLFAIGVETTPLAVRRFGTDVKGLGRRHLQVIFRSKKLVRIILRSWPHYFHHIRSKSAWQLVRFSGFEHRPNQLNVNEIERQRYALNMLGHAFGKSETVVDQATIDVGNDKNVASSSNTNNDMMHNDLQTALVKAFEFGRRKSKEGSLEILLMTSSVDLVHVLDKRPDLCRAIRRVHLMGGFVENPPQKNEQLPSTIWGNYNLNMAPQSSRRLFAMASEGKFPMRMFTYRHVWEFFDGSVSQKHFVKVIKIITESNAPVFIDFLKAAKSWDEHVMKVMPYLSKIIGQFAGKQFSPNDPVLVVGLLNPHLFIKEQRSVFVKIEQEELDSLRDVLEVQIEYDHPTSKIELITEMEVPVFRHELEYSLGLYDAQCFKCGQIGHYTYDCPAAREGIFNRAKKCSRCGRPGHFERDCRWN